MPPRSSAWRCFDKGRRYDGVKTGKCRLCEEVKIFKLNQNSTSPLWIHLEKAHKSDFDGEDEEQFLDCFEDASDSSSEESAANVMEDDAE